MTTLEAQIVRLEQVYWDSNDAKIKRQRDCVREESRLVVQNEVKMTYLAKQERLFEAGDKAGKRLAWLGKFGAGGITGTRTET